MTHYHDQAQTNPIMDTFKLVAETQRQIEHVTDRAKTAVKKHYKDPKDLAAFIEEQGTPVYEVGGFKGLLLRLAMMGLTYDAGFIAPPPKGDKDGIKRYTSLCKIVTFLFEGKTNCSFQKGMFVLPKPLFTVGFIAHQLHHWLAFLAGLPGYKSAEQEEFRQFMVHRKGIVGAEVEQMSEEQIVSLRNAIHREIEALKFIKSVTEEIFRPIRQAKNLSNGTAHA